MKTLLFSTLLWGMLAVLCGTASAQDTVVIQKAVDAYVVQVPKLGKVTLIGLTLPETGAITKRDARDRLDKHVKGKRAILLRDPAIADAKKQINRYVILVDNGQMVNLELIKEGYAAALRTPAHARLDIFVEAEQEARSGKRGAWVIAGNEMNRINLTAQPNPMTDVTMVRYNLPTTCKVSLHVLDPAGHIVATLVDQTEVNGGHTAIFKRMNLPAGEYRCRLMAGSSVIEEKLIVLDPSR